ncbi:MAG: 4Fe-4S binding protein, partial [Candidatus Thermoplasmatota archaeon]
MVKPKAKVDKEKCLACGGCISVCPQDAISWMGNKAFVNPEKCIDCKICIDACPIGAISEE